MRDDLIKRLRRAREMTVEAGGYIFTAMRPTDVEVGKLGLLEGVTAHYEVARDFVIGWGDTFTEADFIRGGASDPLPFERALFAEWLADRPELWTPISSAIVGAYMQHAANRKTVEKK